MTIHMSRLIGMTFVFVFKNMNMMLKQKWYQQIIIMQDLGPLPLPIRLEELFGKDQLVASRYRTQSQAQMPSAIKLKFRSANYQRKFQGRPLRKRHQMLTDLIQFPKRNTRKNNGLSYSLYEKDINHICNSKLLE